MSKNKEPKFPIPHTSSEFLALEQPRKEYDRARAAKRFGTGVALLAVSGIGIDYLADHQIDSISLVAAPIAGAVGSSAHRERGKQQKALDAARSVVEVSPSDVHNIRYQ